VVGTDFYGVTFEAVVDSLEELALTYGRLRVVVHELCRGDDESEEQI
jgi:hypothetical protein